MGEYNSNMKSTKDSAAGMCRTIDDLEGPLRDINHKIWSNPELGYEEFQAHDNIVALLRSLGYAVQPHAHGLQTSFSAEYGTGGRVVAFNAEYDALPGIGHACGHNLIGTASIAAFLGVAAMLKKTGVPGRVRLLGTPAEEGLGGKIHVINAGAYKDVDACLMVHPTPPEAWPKESNNTGTAYGLNLCNLKFNATFHGKPAHAAVFPYQGLNALDAVVLGYTAISMLRQQIRPTERIHHVILDGGKRPNVITSTTTASYYVRSPTRKSAAELKSRVKNCLDAAALATGCKVEYEEINEYADLRPNKPLCKAYALAMEKIQRPVECDFEHPRNVPGSTDQGNVTYECPAIHATFGIFCLPGNSNHTPGFADHAGTDDAHERTIDTAKGMAIAAWQVLTDDVLAQQIRDDFEYDMSIRDKEIGGDW